MKGRLHLNYSERRAPVVAQGHNPDEPTPGYYRIRRGVWRPVAIWYGPPLDPVTGEELDRSWAWRVLYCGRFIWDPTLVWPMCADQRIEKGEYDYLLARIEHADRYDRRDPFRSDSRNVDWLTSSPPNFN